MPEFDAMVLGIAADIFSGVELMGIANRLFDRRIRPHKANPGWTSMRRGVSPSTLADSLAVLPAKVEKRVL
jgi:hypothetical protein